MTLKSEKTGRSIGMPGNEAFPSSLPGKIEIREGGAIVKPTKSRIAIPPGFIVNFISTMVIAVCVFGILTGIGVALPSYSWACIGILIGVINPMGRPKWS